MRLGLFLRQASRPIPRVTRMMRVVESLGVEAEFVGAMREASLPRADRWEGFAVHRVGRAFPLVNGTRPFTYLRGVLSFWGGAVRRILDRRPALLHASDVEAVIPALLAGRILRIPVIYNIHDNLSVRYSLPAVVMAALNVFEGALVVLSDVTLVPESFRRDLLPAWARRRVHVVRNAPEDPGFQERPAPHRPPVVLFAGWLDLGRGLRQVLALARAGRIRLVVAGEGDARLQQELRTTPNVEYVGFRDHTGVMALTRDCDYVAAFYDPARVINRYAASNKIAEALAVGRPVLINRELEVASGLVAAGAAIAVPYAEIGTVSQHLERLESDPTAYVAAGRAARRYYEEHYHSDRVRSASLDALREAGVS